jgi:hypothetical protein
VNRKSKVRSSCRASTADFDPLLSRRWTIGRRSEFRHTVDSRATLTPIVKGGSDCYGLNPNRECTALTEIMGTAFLVHGTWYLRYLDGGGAMVPIEGSSSVKEQLEDAKSVRVTGYMSSDGRGCPRAVHASAVDVFGKSSS